MPCPNCDDSTHKTMIPTADGYEFFTWFQNDVDLADTEIELQPHVPSGFTTHSQSTQEQFFNVSYTVNQVLTFYLDKPCVVVYFISKLDQIIITRQT